MPIPLIVPLAMAAVGLGSKAVGAGKAMKAAKTFDKLQNEVPEAQKSQYVPQMIGTAQMALNANPLLAATQRRNQGAISNSLYQARQIGDPNILFNMVGGLAARSADSALQADMADQQMRDARRAQYINTLQAGMQDEQNFFDQRMANIQSRGSLASAAAKTRGEAWNSLGKGFTDSASAIFASNKVSDKLFG